MPGADSFRLSARSWEARREFEQDGISLTSVRDAVELDVRLACSARATTSRRSGRAPTVRTPRWWY
jgi:hypothetical protein